MKIIYSTGEEGDDPLFDRPVIEQREYVARCMGLGPNWVKDGIWDQLIETLLSVRRNDGKQSFYREIERMLSPEWRLQP